jgi:CheY-like chemotaxis protein
VREHPDSYDLVLMDVTMPEMSGLEAAELIAGLNPALPIILSSGYSSEARAVSGDRFLHLAKPYSVDALVAAIRRARAEQVS